MHLAVFLAQLDFVGPVLVCFLTGTFAASLRAAAALRSSPSLLASNLARNKPCPFGASEALFEIKPSHPQKQTFIQYTAICISKSLFSRYTEWFFACSANVNLTFFERMSILAKAAFGFEGIPRSAERLTISGRRSCLSGFCQSKNHEFCSRRKNERPLALKNRLKRENCQIHILQQTAKICSTRKAKNIAHD